MKRKTTDNTKYNYTFYCLQGVEYVGCTRKKLNQRISGHRASLQNPNNKQYFGPLYEYIRKYHPNFKFAPHEVLILDVGKFTREQAECIEQEWIDKLKPTANSKAAFINMSHDEYHSIIHSCSCGSTYIQKNKARHLRTKRHKTNIQEISNTLNEYYKTSEDHHQTTLKHNDKFK